MYKMRWGTDNARVSPAGTLSRRGEAVYLDGRGIGQYIVLCQGIEESLENITQ